MGRFKYKQKYNPLTGSFDLVWGGKYVDDSDATWQFSVNTSGAWVSTAAAVASNNLLLETGDYILLETGDKLILE